MEEFWKDIKGYEGVYRVSNLGRVKSLDRIDSSGKKRSGRMMKPGYVGKGYLQIQLHINGKPKHFRVNRLVAQAFLPNTDNKPQVNHIDEDKTNNRIDNLEWTTSTENINFGSRNSKVAKANSKPIKVIYRDNTYELWDSATEFAKEFGISQGYINDVLRGRHETAYGMRFVYAKGDEINYEVRKSD